MEKQKVATTNQVNASVPANVAGADHEKHGAAAGTATALESKQDDAKNAVVEPAKNAEKPVQQAGFIPKIDELLSQTRSRRSSTGTKIRPDVGYTLLDGTYKRLKSGTIPEQQATIIRILQHTLTPEKPVIREPELFDLLNRARDTQLLKTKQEAWHVFRYYRTGLINAGILRQIDDLPVDEAEKPAEKVETQTEKAA